MNMEQAVLVHQFGANKKNTNSNKLITVAESDRF